MRQEEGGEWTEDEVRGRSGRRRGTGRQNVGYNGLMILRKEGAGRGVWEGLSLQEAHSLHVQTRRSKKGEYLQWEQTTVGE